MSVTVKIIGSKPNSDEYLGAVRLKRIFEEGLPNSAFGEIILHANATLIGQTVKDIDILMLGTLQNCSVNVSFTDSENNRINDNVTISSFCTAIEIKSHSISGIVRQGTEFYVRYDNGLHPVTTQSNEQKFSVMHFLESSIGCSPYITNVIWFTGITNRELKELLTTDSGVMPSNALPSAFSAKELLQKLVWQKQPYYYRGAYHFDSSNMMMSTDDLAKAFHRFSLAKAGMGELTRKRIEQITTNAIKSSIKKPVDGKLSIYRGRAGTGKTVGLIQLAITLVDEEDARVLILTYNRVLVSDIRRLFTLAELPDLFSSSCVSINTMQSFFFRIVNEVLFNGTLDGNRFIVEYESIMEELLAFLESGNDALELIREVMHSDDYLNWDYCLIDEAQDWLKIEQDVILKLFDKECIIVADGGQQYVRGIETCDWNSLPDRQSTKLKNSLRQKSNIVKFINHYLDELGRNEYRITDSGKLAGGKVIICKESEKRFRVLKKELQELKSAGNIPYDMLFLVPSELVNKNPRKFTQKKLYADHGFFLWDGTNEEERKTYSQIGDEERVLQYDSARGLEAWTVVCIDFDTFVEEKKNMPLDHIRQDSLYLESAEDIQMKNLINWILIPLTRAIDTIVITISDPNSPTAKILHKLANNNPDYVRFIEEDN